MKYAILPFCALAVILAAGGCRRSDVRSVTIGIPSLSATNKSAIVEALYRYDGVRKDSCRFDFENRTLTLHYDSMKVARENLRQSIEEKGFQVVYPDVKGGYAGYLNEKEK